VRTPIPTVLTLISDGSRLTGAYAPALRPESGSRKPNSAIRAQIPLDVVADTIQPFPTFSEIYVAALNQLRAEIAASWSAPRGFAAVDRQHDASDE
jgi:hypothetical protein